MRKARINDPHRPLVSVLLFNYNYGRFLRECFEGVVNQTYDNIEINFSDNASEDESWEIAQEYADLYPGIVTITRNRINFGADANFANCWLNARGKYFIEMCSDDVMRPEFVERCVDVLEAHPEVGHVIVHRSIIDKHGEVFEEAPFYNRSCLIPGLEQAAVYMVAGVNPCVSQVCYCKGKIYGKVITGR